MFLIFNKFQSAGGSTLVSRKPPNRMHHRVWHLGWRAFFRSLFCFRVLQVNVTMPFLCIYSVGRWWVMIWICVQQHIMLLENASASQSMWLSAFGIPLGGLFWLPVLFRMLGIRCYLLRVTHRGLIISATPSVSLWH